MKKTMTILGVAVLLGSCGNPKEKAAESLVREYLQENLKDPSGFEFTDKIKLDSLFTPYEETPEGERLFRLGGNPDLMYVAGTATRSYQEKADSFQLAAKEATLYATSTSLLDSADHYRQKAQETRDLFEANEKNYKGEFVGYKGYVSYKAKNDHGEIVEEFEVFTFDKEMTRVTGAY